MKNLLLTKVQKLFLLLALLALVACNSDGTGFSGAEESSAGTTTDTSGLISTIVIDGHSPMGSPVIMTDSDVKTFALSLSSGSYQANFNFKLDGVSVQSSSGPFYNLAGNLLTTGVHQLEVVVSNPKSTATHSFNIQKNSRPTISSATPDPIAQSMNCTSDTLEFAVNATDAEGDALSFNWLLNGTDASAFFTVTNEANASTALFSPNCAMTGVVALVAQVSDGNDTTTHTWTVTITNPLQATVVTSSPTSDPVQILSNQDQSFAISASGKAPLGYKWKLDGSLLAGATNAIYNVTAGSLTPGAHTLEAIVYDSDSQDSKVFNLLKNAAPVITNFLPVITSSKLSFKSTKSYSISASDDNGDPLSYSWTLDGLTSTTIGVVSNANDSSAVFSPIANLVGNHTITLTVSDGKESTAQSWSVAVNRFSDACNSLAPGEICTVVGAPGRGSTLAMTLGKIRAQFTYIIEDPDHLGNYFASDSAGHSVWYLNNTVADVTTLGLEITAYSARRVVGNGTTGRSDSNVKNLNFKLNTPKGLAYNPNNHSLFIADHRNNQVVQILSDGTGRRAICNTGNHSGSYQGPGAANSRSCYKLEALAFDADRNFLYVANTYYSNIKKFDLSDGDYNNWTGEVLIGRKNSSGRIVSGYDDNIDFGYTTTGTRIKEPGTLALNDDGTVLFYNTYNSTGIMAANLSSSDKSFFGVTVAPGKARSIISGHSGSSPNIHDHDDAYLQRNLNLSLLKDGAAIKGFFISDLSSSRVYFYNNSLSDIELGGETFPSYQGGPCFGKGSNLFNGDDHSGKDTYLNSPQGVLVNSQQQLIVADRDNYRVRSLDLTTADGAVNSWLKTSSIRGNKLSLTPNESELFRPLNLKMHPTLNELFISDSYNGRILKLNTDSGELQSVLGGGDVYDTTEPSEIRHVSIRSLTFWGEQLIYNTGDNNHKIYLYNSSTSPTSWLNTTIAAGKIGVLAGNKYGGSTSWHLNGPGDATGRGAQAKEVRLYRIEGLETDGTNLYFAANYSDCILKITPDGAINDYIGTCRDSEYHYGDENGEIGTSLKINDPGMLKIDPQYSSSGNMFLLDKSSGSSSKLKYINRSAETITIAGVEIAPNQVATVISSFGGYSYGVALFGNWICLSSGGYFSTSYDYSYGDQNILCYDRNNQFGAVGFRVGPSNGESIKAAIQENQEEEGISAWQAHLANPYGIEFDHQGNLFITENLGHSVRMVKRWW